jgi:hyperosmotically inducible protein
MSVPTKTKEIHMRTTLAILAAIAAGAMTMQPASAKDEKNQAFAALDRNSDGFLNKDEAAAEKELAKRFSKFDANKDGKLSEDEYLKAMQDNDKRVVADSAVTTKVKGELLITKGIPSTAISVETYEGRVQLSGFVDTKEQIAAAGKVAAGVSGARIVQNDLKVK